MRDPGTQREVVAVSRGSLVRPSGGTVSQTLEGPFSAVSQLTFGTKYSYCSILRDLQARHALLLIKTKLLKPNAVNISYKLFFSQMLGNYFGICNILVKSFNSIYTFYFADVAGNPR